MRKLLSFVLVVIVACGSLMAKPVDASRARRVAETYLQGKNGGKAVVLSDVTAQSPFTEFYVFTAEGGGFVLVSGDDCVRPVLGYSATTTFEVKAMPAHLLWWFGQYEGEIRYWKERASGAAADPLAVGVANPAVAEEWALLEGGTLPPAPLTTAVLPLLTTTWGQAPYYNALCPTHEDEDYYGSNHVVTGCVATATAQVMKYYNHPTTGYGSHGYEHGAGSSVSFGWLSADFGNTTYQWSSMPNALTGTSSDAEVNAVATLMYHVGVADEMIYDLAANGGSGAQNYQFLGTVRASSQHSLNAYFKYCPDMVTVARDDYSDDVFSAKLRAELDQQRPILYSGSNTTGGHSFVLDGYDADGYFDVNWGWRGNNDGYYVIGSLNPGVGGTGGNSTGTYNLGNVALTKIRPNSSWSTSGVTTVSATTTFDGGEVDGSGSYNFGDTVRLQAYAPAGYRFDCWSDGERFNPREFIATGGSYSFTASYVPISGDVLSYCGDNHNITAMHNESFPYWGIHLTPSELDATKLLNAVQLYIYDGGTYHVTIYTGAEHSAVACSTTVTFDDDAADSWQTISLPQNVAADDDLWILISADENDYLITFSAGCGRDEAMVIATDLDNWYELGNYWGRTAMVKGVFVDGNSGGGGSAVDDHCVITTFPYIESFESEILSCWYIRDLNEDTNSWGRITSYGVDGSICFFAGSPNRFCNELLMTPGVATAGDYTVSWKVRGFSPNYYEKYHVYAYSYQNAEYTLLFSDSVVSDTYLEREIEFTVEAGDTVRIAFQYLNEGTGESRYIFLDDLMIRDADAPVPTTYTLTGAVNDAGMGYVTGGGIYVAGSTATLTAHAFTGHHFVQWHDGLESESRTVTVTGDMTYTAYFAADAVVPLVDTVGYCQDSDTLISRLSYTSGADMTWGIKVPASALTGHSYLQSLLIYAEPVDYKIFVYQGGDEAPGTLIHMQPYVSDAEGWQTIVPDQLVGIDASQNLWVTVVSARAPYTDYSGDPNSAKLYHGNAWTDLPTIGYDYSWMLRAVISNEQPEVARPSILIDGPDIVDAHEAVTFTAMATMGATVTWSAEGATPAAASGLEASFTWADTGSYMITATVSNSHGQSQVSQYVIVADCETPISSYPYSNTVNYTFSDLSKMHCWSSIDGDGDGQGWLFNSYDRFAMSQSWNSSMGALHPSNWMVSQLFALQSGHSYTLTWYDASRDNSYYAEHYGVYVSTGSSADDTASFTLLQEYTLSAGGSATLRTLDLSAYAGQTVRVAFHHYNCSDYNTLLLGYFAISEAAGEDPDPEPGECVVSIPFHETFDESSESLDCWDTQDADGDADQTSHTNHWIYFTDGGIDGGGAMAICNTNTSEDYQGDYLFSPYFTGAGTYTVSWQVSTYGNLPLYYEVYSPGIDNTGIRDSADGDWEERHYTVTLEEGDTAYIGFWYCTLGGGILLIDDFKIEPYTEPEPQPQYTLTVVSANSAMGSVSGSGSYVAGTEVVIRASANDGYHFVSWNDNNSDTVRTVTVTGDITYTAYFAANVGIDDIAVLAVTLFPNPAGRVVTLGGLDGESRITVLDLSGREVMTVDHDGTAAERQIDVSTLARGTYFVRVVGAESSVVRKLILK